MATFRCVISLPMSPSRYTRAILSTSLRRPGHRPKPYQIFHIIFYLDEPRRELPRLPRGHDRVPVFVSLDAHARRLAPGVPPYLEQRDLHGPVGRPGPLHVFEPREERGVAAGGLGRAVEQDRGPHTAPVLA